MRKKLVLGVLAVLSFASLVCVLTGMAAPAVGMGLAWTPLLSSGTSEAAAPAAPLGVAAKVKAFYQGDDSIGWDSEEQYQTWWPSACSPAALTMVLNAWGTDVGIGPVLDRIWNLGAISAENGLTDANALATVAQSYGYQAETFWNWSEQDVADVTVQGVPVMVLLVDTKQQTPYPGFVVGHWLTVVSVSPDQIEVRDSSGYHIQTLSQQDFRTLYTGIGTVVWQGASFKLPGA